MDEVTRFKSGKHEVTRLHFPTKMGVGNINLYVVEYLKNGKKLLVDTGPKDEVLHERLTDLLEQEGHPLESLDALVLTHEHLDHWGGARPLQEKHGSLPVYAHPMAYDAMKKRAGFDDLYAVFDRTGVPSVTRRLVRRYYDRFFEKFSHEILPSEFHPIREGDEMEEFGLRVVDLPGHSAYHIGIEFGGPRSKHLLAGDTVWEGKTPNPFFSAGNPDRGISAYLGTLDRLADSKYKLVLPAHGETVTDLAGYAEFLHDFHESRWERMAEVLKDGKPRNAWQVLQGASILRGRRRYQPPHIFLATCETFGHLEWAQSQGWATSTEKRGRKYYTLR